MLLAFRRVVAVRGHLSYPSLRIDFGAAIEPKCSEAVKLRGNRALPQEAPRTDDAC